MEHSMNEHSTMEFSISATVSAQEQGRESSNAVSRLDEVLFLSIHYCVTPRHTKNTEIHFVFS
jgi:hypothetical protein